MTFVEVIRRILLRDLHALHTELAAYGDERLIWELPPGLKNPAGTLAMHLVGNTRHFIGAVLGESGYVRDREFEFAGRHVPLVVLHEGVDAAIREVGAALDRLSEDDFNAPYPIEVAGHQFTTGLFLTHLVAHFGYHLGQLDYHRRVVTGSSEGAGVMLLDVLNQ